MRLLALSSAMSALLTIITVVALHADDAVLAVAAVAATAVLLTWYAHLHTTEERSSIGLVNPAGAVALAAVGRRDWSTLLPVVVAHVVGGVAGGALGKLLDDRLGTPLVFDADDLVVAGVGAALVGLVGAWTTLALDGGAADGLAALPVAIGGALPIGLVASFSPAVTIGLGVTGLLEWDVVAVAAGACLVASAVAGWAVGFLLPTE